jgi:hypothetical protein
MRIHVLLLLVLLVPAVHAGETDSDQGKVIEKPVVADTPETFAKQSEWIEHEMKKGGRYEFASPADVRRVTALLGQMSNLLQRSGSVAAMDQATKVALFNNQEEVNGILKHNDSNRLVCENIKPVGSNIAHTHCYTFAHIEETRRKTKLGLDEFNGFNRCGAAAGAGSARGSSVSVAGKPDISSCSSR